MEKLLSKARNLAREVGGIDSQIRFRFIVVGRIFLTTMMSSAVLILLLWFVLEVDFLFFSSFNFVGQTTFKETFYEFISQKFYQVAPYVAFFLVGVLLMGFYMAHLMLRPFKKISECCLQFMEDPSMAKYRPDFASDLRLLVQFSELFFLEVSNLLEGRYRKGVRIRIPERFSLIHVPVWEWGFFLQSSVLIILMSALSMAGAQRVVWEVNESLLEFAAQSLESSRNVVIFLSGQMEIFDFLLWVLLLAHIVLNTHLILALYSRVSSPAFGIFATMRSFLRGKRGARVHLIGDYHIRRETKIINRFLDDLERKLQKTDEAS